MNPEQAHPGDGGEEHPNPEQDQTAAQDSDEFADEAAPADAELQTARAEAAQYRDQALRAHAELENVRKRAQRDVESARKFALERFAGDLLGVCDSLEMGLAASAEPDAGLEHFKEGVELTQRMLVQVLERYGVEPVQPQGQPFNPEIHEAVSTQPTDEAPPNTVTSVMQKGYLLNGRVLRPAMVVVSRAAAPDGA